MLCVVVAPMLLRERVLGCTGVRGFGASSIRAIDANASWFYGGRSTPGDVKASFRAQSNQHTQVEYLGECAVVSTTLRRLVPALAPQTSVMKSTKAESVEPCARCPPLEGSALSSR